MRRLASGDRGRLDPCDRQGRLPRRARRVTSRRRRSLRHQLGAARGLRQGRRRERDARRLARRRAARPGGRGAVLRARDERERAVRPVRRHAQPGLRRPRLGDGGNQPRGRGDLGAGGQVPRQGRDDVLLLELGRPHRERRERLRGLGPEALPAAASGTRSRTPPRTTTGGRPSPSPRSRQSSEAWSRARCSRSRSRSAAARRASSRPRSSAAPARPRSAARRFSRGSACARPGPSSTSPADAGPARAGLGGVGHGGLAVRIGLQRDAVVGLAHPDLVRGAAGDGEPPRLGAARARRSARGRRSSS